MSHLSVDSIKRILVEDLEGKKSHQAYYDSDCDQCGGYIMQDEDFYFMGNSEKVCDSCFQSMLDWLNEGQS